MNKTPIPILLQPHNSLKDETIIQFLQKKYNHFPLEKKLIHVSAYFLRKPYILGALGEGEKGIFDQSPLYRTDAFDCVTFVNTVLALTFTKTKYNFEQQLIALNYLNNAIAYKNRCHFMSLDWNRHNSIENHFVEDVTSQIKDDKAQSLAKTAETVIDKNAFFQHRTLDNIKLLKSISSKKAQSILTQLQQLGSDIKPQSVKIDYLPISCLFNGEQLNHYITEQFPLCFVLEIIRPGWNLMQAIGTHLHVSHVGFCFKNKNTWVFRHASCQNQQVVDRRLSDYLNQYHNHETIKGINIQKIDFKVIR